MHFLINPARGSTKKRRRTRARATAKRRRRKSTVKKGEQVAKRRRRRRAVSSNAPKRRRRRRNPGALASARRVRVNRRRRRRNPARARVNARRRRGTRRNPGLLAGGIVNNIIQGVKDGAAVVVGEVGARKVRGAVTGMLPATMQAQVATGMGKIALSIVSSLVVSMIARRAVPGQARFVTAGAFAESINCALAATPLAPFLAAYPSRRINGGGGARLGAWTGAAVPTPRRVGVGAWPTAPVMRSVGTMTTG